ncbi:MAG: hypothetical protein DCE90_18370 [Pseudanabaena sp.]|nr:MAG: hypothetical protein DCE90_18370 [Pseudanabaena sp.]
MKLSVRGFISSLLLILVIFLSSCTSECAYNEFSKIDTQPNALTGSWTAKRMIFVGKSDGCSVASSAEAKEKVVFIGGKDVRNGYPIILIQNKQTNNLILPPVEVETQEKKFCTSGNGVISKDNSKIEFIYFGDGFEMQYKGNANSSWTEVNGKVTCKYNNSPNLAVQDFTMSKISSELPNIKKGTFLQIMDNLQFVYDYLVSLFSIFIQQIDILFGWTCQFASGLSIAGFGMGIVTAMLAFVTLARGKEDFFADWGVGLRELITTRYAQEYYILTFLWWLIVTGTAGLCIVISKTKPSVGFIQFDGWNFGSEYHQSILNFCFIIAVLALIVFIFFIFNESAEEVSSLFVVVVIAPTTIFFLCRCILLLSGVVYNSFAGSSIIGNILTFYFAMFVGTTFSGLISLIFMSKFRITNLLYMLATLYLGIYCVVRGTWICA